MILWVLTEGEGWRKGDGNFLTQRAQRFWGTEEGNGIYFPQRRGERQGGVVGKEQDWMLRLRAA